MNVKNSRVQLETFIVLAQDTILKTECWTLQEKECIMGCCASSTASTGAAFAKGKGQAQTLGANPQNTIPGVNPSKDAAIQRARSKSGGSKAASLGTNAMLKPSDWN